MKKENVTSRLTVNASVSTITDICKKKAAKTERLQKHFPKWRQFFRISSEKLKITRPEHQGYYVLTSKNKAAAVPD